MQIVLTWIRRHVLRRLNWACTVSPFSVYRPLGIRGSKVPLFSQRYRCKLFTAVFSLELNMIRQVLNNIKAVSSRQIRKSVKNCLGHDFFHVTTRIQCTGQTILFSSFVYISLLNERPAAQTKFGQIRVFLNLVTTYC